MGSTNGTVSRNVTAVTNGTVSRNVTAVTKATSVFDALSYYNYAQQYSYRIICVKADELQQKIDNAIKAGLFATGDVRIHCSCPDCIDEIIRSLRQMFPATINIEYAWDHENRDLLICATWNWSTPLILNNRLSAKKMRRMSLKTLVLRIVRASVRNALDGKFSTTITIAEDLFNASTKEYLQDRLKVLLPEGMNVKVVKREKRTQIIVNW
jgi:hypothetical protein